MLLIERGGKPYMFIDIDGPDGWSPADTQAEIALVGEGVDPLAGDWHLAAWQGLSARYQVDTAVWPDGLYVAKARLTRGAEVVVLTADRVRIGADT
jgi:hypothetical protein